MVILQKNGSIGYVVVLIIIIIYIYMEERLTVDVGHVVKSVNIDYAKRGKFSGKYYLFYVHPPELSHIGMHFSGCDELLYD
jgi:hypothetical protein